MRCISAVKSIENRLPTRISRAIRRISTSMSRLSPSFHAPAIWSVLRHIRPIWGRTLGLCSEGFISERSSSCSSPSTTSTPWRSRRVTGSCPERSVGSLGLRQLKRCRSVIMICRLASGPAMITGLKPGRLSWKALPTLSCMMVRAVNSERVFARPFSTCRPVSPSATGNGQPFSVKVSCPCSHFITFSVKTSSLHKNDQSEPVRDNSIASFHSCRSLSHRYGSSMISFR